MKPIYVSLISALIISNTFYGQDGTSVKLKDLAVPNSPAFIIVDLTPSIFQTPNTPKEFILGVAQSYQESSDGFPQNYSAEFAPYWWVNPSGRNVYSAVGLRTTKDSDGKILSVGKENPFSGLKFTTVSLAFVSKDLVPDSFKLNQKIFSIGIKTTLFKIHKKKYGSSLQREINEWHMAASEEFDNNQEILDKLARYSGDDEEKYQQELLDEFKIGRTAKIVKKITEIASQKPLFSWDIAAAHATYGINDSIWRTGRSGIWTTISSYLPLSLNDDETVKNYVNINFVLRYLTDKYQLNDQKKIISGNSIDIGGKIAMDFDKFSIGVEALYRYNNGKSNSQNRTVGVINYKIADNLYLRGAYGKNFNNPNKLIALLGINWGFGSETVKLPE